MSRTVRGKVAVVGIGETQYYKRGEAPDAEFKLALKAILAACEDAGISPKQVDGFASFSNDRSDPSHLAAALGVDDLRFANMQWGGGGRGGCDGYGRVRRGISGIGSGSIWSIWARTTARCDCRRRGPYRPFRFDVAGPEFCNESDAVYARSRCRTKRVESDFLGVIPPCAKQSSSSDAWSTLG